MIHTDVQYKLHGSWKIFFVGQGGGSIMVMMQHSIQISFQLYIETQNNSQVLNLKTHPQSALGKGWNKGYKVQRRHSLVHFYTADTDTGVEYKVQDSSSRDDEAGLVGDAGFKHSSARSTPFG